MINWPRQTLSLVINISAKTPYRVEHFVLIG